MSTASLALLAAGAALVVALVLAVLVLRSRRELDQRVALELVAMGERMDRLAGELVVTVERVREDAQRARLVESLSQALDPDEVVARGAEAAAHLPGVSAATASVVIEGVPYEAGSGRRLGTIVGSGGLVSGPPDGRPVRAVGVSFHYNAGDAAADALRSAVAVPITAEAGQLGFLTVFGATEEPPVAGAEFQALEAIARHVGVALDRPRVEAAANGSTSDALTGLGNREAFHGALALEVARARRRGRRLAVCVLDLDDFRLANERVGQIAADALLVEVAELLRETLRPSDVACRIGGDEFAVMLPEAGRIETEGLFARLQASLRRRPLSPGPPLSLSAGIAELKADDDGVSLFERAERALNRAKEAGKGTAA